MKKYYAIGIIIILFGIIVLPLTQGLVYEKSNHEMINGNILYVGGTGPGNYTLIQDAIDEASDGDIVYVYNDSSPYEECIEIYDRISLIGEDKDSTIIIGDCIENLITINDWEVTISGFTLKRNDSKRYPYYGIYINRDEATITGNIISNIETGISVMSNYNNIIGNELINCGIYILHTKFFNTIVNNYVNGKPIIYQYNKFNDKITDAGQIILFDCKNITVENTNISNVHYGIFLKDSRFCKVKGNNLNNSNIFLRESDENEILNNKISYIKKRTMYSEIGINLQSSNENIIIDNEISFNQGFGLQIYVSNDNIISGNNINKNYNGIRLDDSNSNKINNNNFIGNLENAFFIDCKYTKWNSNYWGRSRIFPKVIRGSITIVPPGFGTPGKYLPWFNFDWYPAKEQH
jgi:parallel beta-helix repeat protein